MADIIKIPWRAIMAKKKRGRPPIPDEERKDAPALFIRLTHLEREKIDEAAELEDVGITQWVRDILVDAATR